MTDIMSIHRETYPLCFWHRNCKKSPSGGIIKVDRKTNIAKCLNCDQRAKITSGKNRWYVPVIEDGVITLISKGQKVSHSVYEVLANISTGMLLAAIVNHYIIFPMIGVIPEIKWDMAVTLIMTAFSIVRSFIFRRIFNRLMLKEGKLAPVTTKKATSRKT